MPVPPTTPWRRRAADPAARALAGIALVGALPYLVWRLGWSQRGVNPLMWAVLLVAELVILGRIALQALVVLQGSRRPVPSERPPVPAELVVLVREEPLVLVRMCIRSCRGVPGVHRLRVLDLYGREDVALACAALGVERLASIDRATSASAFDRILLEAGTEVIGVVPASTVVLPGLLLKGVPLLAEPGVGVVTVAAPARSVPGLVGSAGYPLDVDGSLAVARGLDGRGVALPLQGPALFRTSAVRKIGGFAAASGRPVLATAVALRSAGFHTAVVDEALAIGATPWSEDHALRERARLVGSRVATARRPEVGWFPGGPRGWVAAPHWLAVLELWSPLVRVALLVLMVVVPTLGWAPLSLGDGVVVLGYGAVVADAGRRLVSPEEPVGGRLRRGYRTLWVDLRALAGRTEAPPRGGAIQGQLGVAVALLGCCLVAGLAPLVGPTAGRLPEASHGLLLLGALVLAWLARDVLFAVEDRQRRAVPRTAVRAVGAARTAPGPVATHLSPHGVDVADAGGFAPGEVLSVGLRLPFADGRCWERTVTAVVERPRGDGGFARFDLDDVILDELAHYCAVAVPVLARAGVVPSPVTAVERTGALRAPSAAPPGVDRRAREERDPSDDPLHWLGFYLGTPTG
jgi:hypothetical protein